MMYDWAEPFEAYARDHPEVGPEANPPVRLPPDFEVLVQASPSHVLLTAGGRVVALKRRRRPNARMGEAGRAR